MFKMAFDQKGVHFAGNILRFIVCEIADWQLWYSCGSGLLMARASSSPTSIAVLRPEAP
jgi:hypothetical protein